MHPFHAAGTPRMGTRYAKRFFGAVPFIGNPREGRAFFGKPSLPQKLFHYFSFAPQHFLYFLPLPQGHGSLRPTFGPFTIVVEAFCAL